MPYTDHRDWLRSAAMTIPQDFLDALEAIPAAKAFFQTLDRKNLYPIYYRLHTARCAGMSCFIDPFDRPGDGVLPQRRGLLIVQ